MAEERWFPARHQLPDGPRLSRLLCSGPEWQIYRLDTGNLILVARQSLADRWVGSRLLTHAILGSVAFGDVEYKTIVSGVDQRLEPVAECRAPDAKVEGLAFAQSLNATRKIDEVVPLHDAIYVERYSRFASNLDSVRRSNRRRDTGTVANWWGGNPGNFVTAPLKPSWMVGKARCGGLG